MNCPNCGTPVEKPGKFCAECGAPLAATTSPADWSKLPPPPPPDLALSAPPPPPAPAAGGSRGGRLLLILAGLVVVAVVAGGVVAGWPQISKQLGLAAASPSAPAATASPSPSESPGPLESPGPTPIASTTIEPTASPTAAETESPSPVPSALTSGYATPELAIEQFVSDQGYAYGGDCASASSGADYCSSLASTLTDGRVYGLGGLASEVEVWVLLRQIDGQWYVVGTAPAGGGSPAPWH
jgi:hypothetical protein